MRGPQCRAFRARDAIGTILLGYRQNLTGSCPISRNSGGGILRIVCRNLALITGLALLPWQGNAVAQGNAEADRSLVFKVGPAFDRSLADNKLTLGGSLGVEGTAIENWLEVEAGVTRFRSGGRRADSVGLQFKKPFRLSRTVELMIGVGPSVGRDFRDGTSSRSRAIEFSVDLMVWPSPKIGWFVEPSYGYGVGPSRGDRSFGASAGILIAF